MFDGSVTSGNVWLILCCASYLIWWAVAFHPKKPFPFPLKLALFLVTLALGIAGVCLTVGAIASLPESSLPCPVWLVALIAIAVYALLLFGSARLLHRQVTTELALIVGWCGLESALIECLWAANFLTGAAATAAFIVTIVCAAASLACYLAYYRLRPMPAYLIAMAPLALCAVAMAVTVGLTL